MCQNARSNIQIVINFIKIDKSDKCIAQNFIWLFLRANKCKYRFICLLGKFITSHLQHRFIYNPIIRKLLWTDKIWINTIRKSDNFMIPFNWNRCINYCLLLWSIIFEEVAESHDFYFITVVKLKFEFHNFFFGSKQKSFGWLLIDWFQWPFVISFVFIYLMFMLKLTIWWIWCSF